MFKLKTLAFAALLALATWGVASLMAPAGPAARGPVAAQIDATDLMSKAGKLPVETAPEI